MNKMHSLVAIAAIASEATGLPIYDSVNNSQPFSGRIVGHDMGKGRKLQPRNAVCVCGSGLKAKKCCVYYPQQKNENDENHN